MLVAWKQTNTHANDLPASSFIRNVLWLFDGEWDANEASRSSVVTVRKERFSFRASKEQISYMFPFLFFPVGFRYLRSLVETILIYQHFNKPGVEQPAPKQELVDFWMDFLVEATKKDVTSVRFPVRKL